MLDNIVVLNNLVWLYYKSDDLRVVKLVVCVYELSFDNVVIVDIYGWIMFKIGVY